MTVEQTSQLIQLILNSVLMVIACVVLLGALLVRHTAIYNRIRMMNHEYFQLFDTAVMFRGDRLLHLKQQLQQLRQQHYTNYSSLLATYSALLVLALSTLTLSLRALFNWPWLIVGSLICFAIGVAIWLIGVGLALIEFYTARRSLLEEISWVLNLGSSGGHSGSSSGSPVGASNQAAPSRSPRRSLPPRRSLRKLVRSEGQLPGRVG
jgi:hypothetical protein